MNELDPIASFPYPHDSEPTEDWTVEQLLQWCLIQARRKNSIKSQELIHRLSEQLDVAKKEVWQLHEEAVNIQRYGAIEEQKLDMNHHDINQMTDSSSKENSMPYSMESMESQDKRKQVYDDRISGNGDTSHTVVDETISAASSHATKLLLNPSDRYLSVQVIEGPYQGMTYTLKPTLQTPCWIGRSAGKKFRENGISFPKNPEVSTTHGKVHMQVDDSLDTEGLGTSTKRWDHVSFYYTDTGSTNGTLYQQEELQDNVPLKLHDGIEIIIGGSLIRFHFLSK